MKRFPGSLAALALPALFAAPALADTPSFDPDGKCRMMFDKLIEHVGEIKTQAVTAKASGGCRFDGVRYPLGQMFYTAEHVDIDRVNFGPAGSAAWPQALQVSVTGVRIVPAMDAAMQFVMSLSPRPWSVRIDYSFDIANEAFTLNEFSFRVGHSSLNASAVLARFTPAMAAHPPAQFLTQIALKSLKLDLRDEDGDIENLILMPLGIGLLKDAPDPSAKAAELKQQGADWLRSNLALVNAPPASIDSLVALLTSFPQATQPFKLSVDLPQPVGMVEVINVLKGNVPSKDAFPPGAMTATYGQ